MDKSLFEQDKLDKRRNKKNINPWDRSYRSKKWHGEWVEIKPGKVTNETIKRHTEERAETSKTYKDQHQITLRLKELESLRSECLEAIKSHVQTSKNDELLA